MFKKFATENDPVSLMSAYVAFLRALYSIHQRAHWKAKGKEFYGSHLLFERLYSGTQETADQAAEKTIGLFGELNDETQLIADICDKFTAENFDDNYVQASLKAEQAFLAFSQTIYNQIKNLKAMTLGLDNLVQEISHKHEVHVYLLKQSFED